jgi:MoaA/NifB/PqqE/SkfB family radical SAM enzyme
MDALFTEAEELGVATIVITGGEPLLRADILDLAARHQRLLFVLITNGSLVTRQIAGRIAWSGNVVPLVSIEGSEHSTDERRRPHAHATAIRAFECLLDARANFGFSAMTTAANMDNLVTDAFVDQMVAVGCVIGFFIEYVPCGPNPRLDWTLDEATRTLCRQRVLDLRRRKPIVLSQFPHDEYGEANQCKGAGRESLHISAQGDIEPCPFVSCFRENIRKGGLIAACRSPFLRAIREQPTLLQRRRFGCSLFEHRDELEALVQQFDTERKEKTSDARTLG